MDTLEGWYATCARCGGHIRLHRLGCWVSCSCGWAGQDQCPPTRPLRSGHGLVADAIGRFAAGRP